MYHSQNGRGLLRVIKKVKALNEPHMRPVDFTGGPMRAYVFVGRDATKTDRALKKWLDRSIGFASMLAAKNRR